MKRTSIDAVGIRIPGSLTPCRPLGFALRCAASALLPLALALSPTLVLATGAPTLLPKWTVQLEESETCVEGNPPYDISTATFHEVQHDAAGNIHVNANGVLRSYTRDGALRWKAPQCPGCATPEDRGNLRPFAVMPSGEVWALEARTSASSSWPPRFAALHRLDRRGAIVQTRMLAGTVFEGRDTLLRSTTHGAVLIAIVDHVLHALWLRGDAAQTVALPLPSDRDTVTLYSATVVENGDILVAAVARDLVFCPPGIPCDVSDTFLLRLSAEQGFVWRRDVTDPRSMLTFGEDQRLRFIDSTQTLVSVNADGDVTSTALAPDVDTWGAYGVAGPIDGYLLIQSEVLVTVDLAGHAAGHHAPDENPYRYPWNPRLTQVSSAGFVVPFFMDDRCHAAAVYAPSTLAERYRLHVEGTTCVNDPASAEGPMTANLIATTTDGGITLLRQECGAGSEPTIVARFGLPGTPVGDLLMRDDFESSSP